MVGKTVLVVENHPGAGPGRLGEVLVEDGAALEIVRGWDEQPLPRTGDHDALLILGGPMSALDDHACPYFPSLLDLIRDFDARNRPVLGICLGAQLIARAYGSEVLTDQGLEFGFSPVLPHAAAAEDPLMSVLDLQTVRFFEWHQDTFELPDEAVLLASSDRYPNQAFRLGEHVHGLQFHFEVSGEMVDRWLAEAGNLVAEAYPDYREWYPGQRASFLPQAEVMCHRIGRAWAGMIKARQSVAA